MIEVPIKLPEGEETSAAIARIESALSLHNLTVTSRGTLKSYPGCTHWHVKLGRTPGTLEVTLWPAKRRAWFKVQAGRRAAWIDQIISQLKSSMEDDPAE